MCLNLFWQWRVRPSLVLSDLLCNGSSDAKALALSSAGEGEGDGPQKGFAFATSAFSGQSFESLSASMLVTSPEVVSSVRLLLLLLLLLLLR